MTFYCRICQQALPPDGQSLDLSDRCCQACRQKSAALRERVLTCHQRSQCSPVSHQLAALTIFEERIGTRHVVSARCRWNWRLLGELIFQQQPYESAALILAPAMVFLLFLVLLPRWGALWAGVMLVLFGAKCALAVYCNWTRYHTTVEFSERSLSLSAWRGRHVVAADDLLDFSAQEINTKSSHPAQCRFGVYIKESDAPYYPLPLRLPTLADAEYLAQLLTICIEDARSSVPPTKSPASQFQPGDLAYTEQLDGESYFGAVKNTAAKFPYLQMAISTGIFLGLMLWSTGTSLAVLILVGLLLLVPALYYGMAKLINWRQIKVSLKQVTVGGAPLWLPEHTALETAGVEVFEVIATTQWVYVAGRRGPTRRPAWMVVAIAGTEPAPVLLGLIFGQSDHAEYVLPIGSSHNAC